MKKLKISIVLMMGILLFQLNIVKAEELKIHAIECTVQGDSTLLESNGKYLLMDTCIKQDENKVLEYLDKNNVTEFDLYLSHYHIDHYGLIMDILNNSKYTIKNIYLPEYNKNDSLINQINPVASEKSINVTYLKKGSEFNFEKAKISIVGPIEDTENLENKINNNSLVAKIKIDNTVFLTAGDIEKEQEELLLKNNVDLKADIMKLSHHGGKTSNTIDFIKAVNPKFAYFSYYGENEKANFASDAWVKNTIANVNDITNVLSTGYNGNIVYDINNDAITITPTRNYVEKKINYIDFSDNKIMKTIKEPYVKNTKFHYSKINLANYEFIGEDTLSGTVLDDDQNINLYYQSILNNSPLIAAISDEDIDDESDEETSNTESLICSEQDGSYYDKDGQKVSKEEYYNDCGVVDNPKTGNILPMLSSSLGLLFGFIIIANRKNYLFKKKL